MPSPDAAAQHAVAARVAAAYAALPQVAAVALAGSRAAGAGDARSDIDLYVYAEEPVPMTDRRAIADRFAARREVGNAFWEPGDEWIDDATGLHVDVMFRTPAWIEAQLDRVLARHEAATGYSTCFWHNVLHSTPLFDRTGWYGRLQAGVERPYPEALKRAIVAKNHPLLRNAFSAYRQQIARAALRGDSVSIQHRVSALLASYFDILFAVNELPHPGEKRMLPWAMAHCLRTPPAMEHDVHALLHIGAHPADPAILGAVDALIAGLDALLTDDGWGEAVESRRGR